MWNLSFFPLGVGNVSNVIQLLLGGGCRNIHLKGRQRSKKILSKDAIWNSALFQIETPQSSELEGPPPAKPPSYGSTDIPLPDKHHMVTKHTMRDFIGLEKADEEARKAMMNFSYLSAIGNMDEAFKAIKLIKRFVCCCCCFFVFFSIKRTSEVKQPRRRRRRLGAKYTTTRENRRTRNAGDASRHTRGFSHARASVSRRREELQGSFSINEGKDLRWQNLRTRILLCFTLHLCEVTAKGFNNWISYIIKGIADF